MTDTPSLASTVSQDAHPSPAAGGASGRRHGLATLPDVIAIWGERLRYRRDLRRKLKHSPHLIDDIGLTSRQAEAEIAKPFWQE